MQEHQLDQDIELTDLQSKAKSKKQQSSFEREKMNNFTGGFLVVNKDINS